MKKFPRNTAWLSLVAVGAAGLLTACGGGDTSSSSGGGGAGGTTTSSGGTTASGGTGGDTGGTTSMGAPDGSPCAANTDCANGFCLTQAQYGWPYGYCTGACNSVIPCADGSSCLLLGNDPFCIKQCPSPSDCGKGQTCIDPGDGNTVCAPFCMTDAECAGYGKCDMMTNACYVPEDCSKPGDEDGDGLSDCEDSDCAAMCMTQIDAACGAAVAINLTAAMPTVTKNGDNTNGTDLFAGLCSGSANKENLFKVTNGGASDGIVELSLVSDQDLAVYARTDCATQGDVACSDGLAGGADPEVIDVTVTKGASTFVYVDGSSFGGGMNAGTYTLTATLLSVQTETEMNNAGPMPGPSTANPVSIASLPAIVGAAVDQASDNDDWFVIDTTALGTKTITAETIGYGGDQCGPAGDVDTNLEIVDSTGAVLVTNDDVSVFSNWCSAAETAMVAGGKYYLHVSVSTICMPMAGGPDCVFKYGLKINIK